ncbi:acyltransferase family protein [Spirosoma taeanense]|uniref:Acyltransferase family protein n=1 Tax=Spirosoma taeanense TaxID=2735870 RepID=A0A6M5Y7J4_9BACT|nr:acyltransferase family protein [Spirosoma taeanense]QJW89310.1 acyltransferase family protein [Spirosoma taeanense]
MAPVTQPTSNSIKGGHSDSLRRYDLDWLRVIAILTLLFYHTGMIYVSWWWHIKSAEHSQPMEEVMRWLHRWRMPLLFFISGAGTFFALRKRSFGAYAGERVRRLFVPLVFGMFVVVPPQIYYEWLFRSRFSGSYAEFYPVVLEFKPYHGGPDSGAFSWHHLWFVAYLFLYSVLSIPLFRWLKSARGQRLTDHIGSLIERPGGVMVLGFVVIFSSQILLKPFFPNETHALINDWAYFVKNLLLFWLGYVLISRRACWQTLTDQRRLFLYATLVSTVLLYAIRTVYEPENQRVLVVEVLYEMNADCLTWFSVLMTVAYGYKYLNVNRPVLPYLNEAVYPFYILHQTVIVIIGYYVLTKTRLGVYDGFLTVSLSSLVVCVTLYLLLIRPFKLTRLLFGMK